MINEETLASCEHRLTVLETDLKMHKLFCESSTIFARRLLFVGFGVVLSMISGLAIWSWELHKDTTAQLDTIQALVVNNSHRHWNGTP